MKDVFKRIGWGGGSGCAKAQRCQTALCAQEAQHPKLLELNKCTGAREGDVLGDTAGTQVRA